MFKRVRWMGMGAVVGVGASAWTQRRLRKTLAGHPSIRAGADVVSAARRVGKGIGREVGAAVADGRRAMADREQAIRAELDEGRGLHDGRPGRWPGAGHPSASGRDGFIPGPLRVVDATSTVPRPPAGRPATGHPAAGRPVAARPVAPRPVAPRPIAARPDAARPDADRPLAARPGADRPVAGRAVAGDPVTSRRSAAPAGRRVRPPSEPALPPGEAPSTEEPEAGDGNGAALDAPESRATGVRRRRR